MRAIIETEVILDKPSVDQGLVTWLAVRVLEDLDDDAAPALGRARVARSHVGDAIDARATLYDVLDADSAKLEALFRRSSTATTFVKSLYRAPGATSCM